VQQREGEKDENVVKTYDIVTFQFEK